MLLYDIILLGELNMKFDREDTRIIKALAIMLMLYHHLFAFPNRIHCEYISLFHIHNKNSAYMFGVFGKICVAIFFLLAGYGIYKQYQKNNSLNLKQKILSLYKRYWQVLFIIILLSLVLKSFKLDLSLLTLLGNISALNITYSGEWWFLIVYIIFTLMSPIIIKIIDNKHLNIGYNFFFLMLYNTFVVPICFHIFALDPLIKYAKTTIYANTIQGIFYLPSYICGLLLAKYKIFDIIKNKCTKNYLYLLGTFILIVIIFITRNFIGPMYDFVYATAIIISFIILINYCCPFFKKILVSIGNESTNIWLIHSFYCYVWCQKFIFMPRYSILIFLLLLLISYLSSIIINNIYKYLMLLFNNKKRIKLK